MGYWVEYSFQKGIRENLMTDDIAKARRTVLECVKHTGNLRATAWIYSSRNPGSMVGNIIYLSDGPNKWCWQPAYRTKAYPIRYDGTIDRKSVI